MEMWFVVALVVGVSAFIFLIINKKASIDRYPYEQQDMLFSAAERSFYGALCQAVSKHALVFGKVRVADVVKPTKGLDRGNWQRTFNRIASKHFDFLLCNPDDLSVAAVIELDDSSHGKNKQISRDQFIEGLCESVGLPLYRFKANRGYNVSDIREELFPSTISEPQSDKTDQTTKSQLEENDSGVFTPRCPKCSSELVIKTAKKGPHKDSTFLACSAFPKCRYIAIPGANSQTAG